MTRANPIPAKGYTGTQISEIGPDTFGAVAGYLNDLLAAQITLHDSTIAERPSYLEGVSPAFWSYYNQANGVRTAYLWDGVRDVPILSVSTDGVLTISGLPFADLNDKTSSDKTVSPAWVAENVGISPVAYGVINGNGTISNGYGIVNVVKTGDGAYTINHAASNSIFAVPMVITAYDPAFSRNFASAAIPSSKTQTKIQIIAHDATLVDGIFIFAIF